MDNKFYVPGAQRAARVNDLFASIAKRYDLINDLQSFGLHRRWKRKLVRLANVQPSERALDLCCGTGDVAFSLSRHGARVVGLDFSGPMLAVAATRRQRTATGTPGTSGRPATGPASDFRTQTLVAFLRGDAMIIPFADASFDVVTISYGLRNLASVERGLREMWRVTRPGGRILVLDFGKPPHHLWRAIYFAYLRLFVPSFGRIFCGDAETYAYIFESLRRYPSQEGVAAAMRDLNCANVRVVNLLGGIMSIHYGEKPAGVL
jgi:demethylmenaquinone methyltransferase / 2-methoxy-6-polyprenyl-1,4-benzoquinol methylase